MTLDSKSALSSSSRLGSRLFSVTLVCAVPVAAVALAALQPRSAQRAQADEPTTALVERGQSLYTSLCTRCHGADGDSTDYSGIVPLTGIDLRVTPGEIAGLSAPFVGRTFEGEEAEALVAYLGTLGGAKGFAEPGYLFSVYLLDHKLQNRQGYRILDTRPEAAYEKGHIPNAVCWPIEDPVGSSFEEVRKAMNEVGISGETFVVVYDKRGGPDATSVWWNLRRAGHRRAAVLDGGLQAWREAGHRLSTHSLQIEPTSEVEEPTEPDTLPATAGEPILLHLGSSSPDRGIAFDWRKTVNEEGLLPADGIETYLAGSGFRFPAAYRIEGNRDELGYLIWLLTLTGREASYDAGLLTVSGVAEGRLL